MVHDGIKPPIKYADIRLDVRVTFRDNGFMSLEDQAIEALDDNDYEILFAEVLGKVRDTEYLEEKEQPHV